MLNAVLPVCLIMLLGFVATKRGYFSDYFANDLILFVLNIALPALIFVHIASISLAEVMHVRYLLAYLLGLLLVYGVSFFVGGALFGGSLTLKALRALAGTFANTGYFGIPVLTLLVGPQVIVPIVIATLMNDLVIMPLALCLIESDLPKTQRQSILRILLNTMKRPLILAPFLALICSAVQLPLPGVLTHALTTLSEVTSGLALFAIGLVMAKQKLTFSKEVALNLVTKLLLQPVVTLVLVLMLGVHGIWAVTAVLLAALPMGATPVLFAERYRQYRVQASSTLLASTLLSLLSLSLISVWLQGLAL